MKLKILLVFALTMLFVPPALAEVPQAGEIDADTLVFVLQQQQSQINEGLETANMPGPLKAFLNGKYNVVIDDTTIGIEMAGGKLKTVKEGGLDKPTTTFTLSEETLVQIGTADDQMDALLTNLKNGNIKREDHSVGAKVKGTVLSLLMKFF